MFECVCRRVGKPEIITLDAPSAVTLDAAHPNTQPNHPPPHGTMASRPPAPLPKTFLNRLYHCLGCRIAAAAWRLAFLACGSGRRQMAPTKPSTVVVVEVTWKIVAMLMHSGLSSPPTTRSARTRIILINGDCLVSIYHTLEDLSGANAKNKQVVAAVALGIIMCVLHVCVSVSCDTRAESKIYGPLPSPLISL